MKRLLLFGMTLIAASGIAVGGAQPACAQTNSYDLVATPEVPGTSGNWDVTIEKWNGTTDGPGTQFRFAFAHGESFPDDPNDSVSRITVTFYSYLGTPGGVGTIPVQSITGQFGTSTVTTSHPTTLNQSNDWSLTNVKYNPPGSLENQAKFEAGTVVLKKGGTNSALQDGSGRINLKYKAYSVKITLENAAGTRIWSAGTDLSTVNAPEGSSLALLATGLVPLGLLVRRRSRSRNSA